MKFAFVSYHLPAREGSAAGRILLATTEGLLALGHEVRVWAWGGRPPANEPPEWCQWHPVPVATRLRMRARALTRPRSEIERAGWPDPDESWLADAIAVADEFLSFPAVATSERSVLTLHYRTALDEAALGRRRLAGVQERRAERRACRSAGLVLAYSRRVAHTQPGAVAVPAAIDVPASAALCVDRPDAVVLADWRWPPNRWALDRLLRAWPAVRRAVPAARLRLAGSGLDVLGTVPGVENLGRVSSSRELLAEAAVVPFPCPPTSGPKVKVMEAMALGLPVLTTPAGTEGLALDTGVGALVTDPKASPDRVARDLIALLVDPDGRAALGRSGRQAMLRSHAARPAAQARATACAAAFAGSDHERSVGPRVGPRVGWWQRSGQR